MELVENNELYSTSKKQNKRVKDLLRNQMIFGVTMLEQSDEKANMLLSLSISFFIGIFVVYLEFESYVHFPFWILLLLALGFLSTALFILLTVKPNFRFISKIIENELTPSYPKYEQQSFMYDKPLTLDNMEVGMSNITSDSKLQIGNMVRANYIMNKYLSPKYKCIDIAFVIFLLSMFMFFVLFMINVIASTGGYHDHSERKEYVPYDFEKESNIFNLPSSLAEVSGLAFDSPSNTIYTHNDEEGIVFQIDAETGRVIDEIKIAKKGDFEAIELVGNDIILSTSSGTLYYYNKLSKELKKENTQFKSYHDVEGLHKHSSGKLIVACKEKKYYPSKADKGLYLYDSKLQKVDDEPFLEIYIDSLRLFAEDSYEDKNKQHSLSQRLKSFSPSGVAVHPSTQDVYIVSGRNSMLVVYNQKGAIKDIIGLNPQLISQPEGICFDPNGDLFISTEGKGGLGKIFRYNAPNDNNK